MPSFGPSETSLEACAQLEQAGWERIAEGEGDWSWVFAAPDGDSVARITPWDPAYLLFAEVCLRHSDNAYLPRIESVSPLISGGYVLYMERLQPANEEQATALCRAIGIPNDTGEADWMEAEADTSTFEGDEDIIRLRGILREAMSFGASHIPFWGGCDIGTRDVMVAADGQLKLLDPFFVRGQALVEAILTRQRERLRPIPNDEIEASLTIPFLEARYSGSPDPDELRRIFREMTAGDSD